MNTASSKRKTSKPANQLRDIFSYHDYREFLKDWLADRKAGQSSRFSLRKLADEAELTVGYLSLVLSGKRPLSAKALPKLLNAMHLERSAASYFRFMVLLGTSDEQEERLKALDGMQRFRAFQKLNPREIEVYQYLKHWYYVAIREMATLPEFRAEPEWIQSKLRTHVDIADIREALDFLIENQYIEIFPNGSARPPEKKLECEGGVFRVALGQFHREIFELAAQSIENTPSAERNLLGYTLAIGPDHFDQASAILSEALEKIRRLNPAPIESDSVYQVQLALFPLTGGNKK